MSVSPDPRYARREENTAFADDASYESVRRTLEKLTFKCFLRVQAMGLGMTIDDVRQEMNLTYVQARAKWNPEGGSRFNTYLITACYNNFNDRIARAERERAELGMVNLSDMRRTRFDDDGDADPLEWIDAQDATVMQVPEAMFGSLGLEGTELAQETAPMGCNPEFVLEHRQEVRASMGALTPAARKVVTELLAAAHKGKDLPRLSEIAQSKNITKAELRRIRAELAGAFGVKI